MELTHGERAELLELREKSKLTTAREFELTTRIAKLEKMFEDQHKVTEQLTVTLHNLVKFYGKD